MNYCQFIAFRQLSGRKISSEMFITRLYDQNHYGADTQKILTFLESKFG